MLRYKILNFCNSVTFTFKFANGGRTYPELT